MLRWITLAMIALLNFSQGAEVSNYGIAKTLRYEQTSEAVPVLTSSPDRALFLATVVAGAPDAIRSANLTPPARSTQALRAADPSTFELNQLFESEAAMTAAFPNGNFNFSIQTVSEGEKKPSITLSSSSTYPPIPHLISFNSFDSVDSHQTFTVRWNAYSNPGANDQIVFLLRDGAVPVFQRLLAKEATQLDIPPGTLKEGVNYSGSLGFVKVVAVNFAEFPTLGFAALSRETQFSLRTQPLILSFRKSAEGIEISLRCAIGKTYVIEKSQDLIRWSERMRITADEAQETFRETETPASRFYRAFRAD